VGRLLGGVLGNAAPVEPREATNEFGRLLAPKEQVFRADKLVADDDRDARSVARNPNSPYCLTPSVYAAGLMGSASQVGMEIAVRLGSRRPVRTSEHTYVMRSRLVQERIPGAGLGPSRWHVNADEPAGRHRVCATAGPVRRVGEALHGGVERCFMLM
jgi:hypothetical protein